MSEFNNAGVPYFAHKDFPAVRPRAIPEPSEEYKEGKANQMQARRYVREFIQGNWNAGDRFFFTTVEREYYHFRDKTMHREKSQHGGKSGRFIERRLVGTAYFIIVEWDDKDYKPIGLYNRVGMFDFFHYAFKAS